MKPVKSLVSLIVILAMVVLPIRSASAAPKETSSLGDVDADGSVTIVDATYLQLHIADRIKLSDSAVLRGDTDLDGYTAITDVTHIQRYLAGCNGAFYLGMDIEAAKTAKANDEAAAQAKIAEEEAAAAEALAKQGRTKQAQTEYLVRLNGSVYSSQASVEESIRTYQRQKGVDISEHNGDVDFNILKAQGYSFVMIRLGWGSNKYSQDDAKFEENVRKAEEVGMPWGAYLYSYALDTTAVQSEIQHTLRLLKGKTPTMPIAFDIEDDDFKYDSGMPSDQMLHDICLTYLRGIEAAGYYPILYTGYDWLTGALNNPDLTGTYDIWYAQWYTEMQYNTPKVGMWQYGGETNFLESAYIAGLDGPFDKNFCFKNYPVIITAYGYNNHPALFDRTLASTSALPFDNFETESGEAVPEKYNGVMGDSFREK